MCDQMLQGNTVIIKIIIMSNILINPPKLIKKDLCAIFKGGRGDVTGHLDTAPDHPGHQGDALALPDMVMMKMMMMRIKR